MQLSHVLSDSYSACRGTQAKEMLDHLESVLSNEPVEVVMGNTIVEVKPQGVSKGGAVERILLELSSHDSAPDFILCVGDDRSDEDMFTAIDHVIFSPHLPAEVHSPSPCPCVCAAQGGPTMMSQSCITWSFAFKGQVP